MSRIYNFSAGPSVLPEKVLERAASELVEYGSSGQSVMEMSHRSPEYDAIIKECEALLRELMGIPDDYKVLMVQGGASTQFAAIPMNLMGEGGCADYFVTGEFSTRAAKEATKYGKVNEVASGKADNFSKLPDIAAAKLDPKASYVHICQNNTIYGTRFTTLPQTGDVPLVSDMSSCILSEPVDVSKFGLIYAGAQKNMAPAGLTVVIVKESLLGKALPFTPTMLDYSVMAKNDSMYNTPSTYPIYICKLVLEWIKNDIGGLEKMAERNRRKAKVLYDFLDGSKMFKATVSGPERSLMNVTFVTGNDELDAKFCKEAKAAGFYNLKGHRSVGGMRASIYNAMPEEGIAALVAFMKEFEKNN
ncbi:MAG: 3-phosphoserine/phosphohydroxythreonine transaminase [Oscillospiraceae bacterium]|nr:3-phosphoserine/phosphohydroxythreonine transaminase [Oscillospiraceae bacterium]